MIYINDVRYVKVWKAENKGKFISLQCSTSEKNQQGEYENSSWNVILVGNAYDQGKHLEKGDTFTINKGKITNVYNKKHEKSFLNVVVFDIETEKKAPQQNDFEGFQAMDGDLDIPF